MTVKELAKYLKLSEMMVYKLAQGGGIPASKIGSAWRFSQDAVDEWLMKNSTARPPFPEPVAAVLSDFVASLREKFGKNLFTVLVYGSYARGEADSGSDVDVLAVLSEIDDHRRTKEEIRDIAYRVSFGSDRPVVLSAMVMAEAEFLTGSSPALINIRREGVKAA